MKLLIIEDETDMLSALKKGFEKMGYAIDTAEDGEAGSYLAEINSYDMIVLDLNLPGKDGLQVLEEIRKRDKTQKVIILSARSSVPDKILGLDMGANDYLAKPFDFMELEARVRSLARRAFVQNDTCISVDLLTVDTKRKQILYKNAPVDFSPKEYAILEYLALHKGQVVSTEDLIEHVWESDADFFEISVKVHISNIRKKLDAVSSTPFIQTVRGCGYLMKGTEE